MKALLAMTALAVALSTTAAVADGIAPQMDVTVIQQDSAATTGGIFVPVLAIALLLLLHTGGASETHAVLDSDERLKTDITRVGTTPEGIGIFEWRYVWSDQMYRGVIAQDVVMHRPDAVVTGSSGFLAVDYRALGMEMVAID